MDVIGKLNKLRLERNISVYRLAELSGINQSTLANTFSRGTVPSIYSLEQICNALGITLAQFFTEDNVTAVLNEEDAKFYDNYLKLPIEVKEKIRELTKAIIENNQ